MIANIQKHEGEFANINTLTAFLGFREKGYEVRFFEWPELPYDGIQPDHRHLRRMGSTLESLVTVAHCWSRLTRLIRWVAMD